MTPRRARAGTSVIRAGTALVRIHPSGRRVLWFGPGEGRPPRNRFDPPDGSFGVCYLAMSEAGAFAETFLRDPELSGPEARFLFVSELIQWRVSEIVVQEDLPVARVRGAGLQWHGRTAEITASGHYRESQALARMIHEDRRRPGGIEYRCRHDNDEIAVAVFERARKYLKAVRGPARDCLLLAKKLRGRYGFVIEYDR